MPDSRLIDEKTKINSEFASGIWLDYPDIYHHAKTLYEKLSLSKTDKIFIVLGRGGWICSRILFSFYEMASKPIGVFSIIPTYENRNSKNEKVLLSQGLDSISINKIKRELKTGSEIWLLDAPFVTGGTMMYCKKYIDSLFQTGSKIAVFHYVKFDRIEKAEWRKPPKFTPDLFAEEFNSNGKNWYVQYPWEWTDYQLYQTICRKYRKSLSETHL